MDMKKYLLQLNYTAYCLFGRAASRLGGQAPAHFKKEKKERKRKKRIQAKTKGTRISETSSIKIKKSVLWVLAAWKTPRTGEILLGIAVDR